MALISVPASGGRLAAHRVPMILMYHAVAEAHEDPNQLCVTPARFAEQMAALQRLGLRGVGVGTLVGAIRAGRARGLVGITFDDGYASVLEAAVPELCRRGFTATVFVVSNLMSLTLAYCCCWSKTAANWWTIRPAWRCACKIA